ncbi:MAG: hypothetical protein FVQ83_16505 [Chloroflexi bacterium]|nr:hypothetical protein [Chloroflexota bacterium]
MWANRKESIRIVLMLSFGLFFWTACTPAAPEPTATLAPTNTPSPLPTSTQTLTPSLTNTSTPSATYTNTPILETSTPTLSPTPRITNTPRPTNIPRTEWNGIPIMPGAFNGDDGGSIYSFNVDADIETIQNYYQSAMPQAGWNLFATGEGNSGSGIMLMFDKGGQFAFISVAILPGTSVPLVILTIS